MGLLALGTALEWPDAKKRADQVRKWGIEQLLANWRRARGKERDALLWGDEVEYLVVAVDEEAKKARLSLAQAEILKSLAKDEALWKSGESPRPENKEHEGEEPPHFHPEFGRFMLEATPGRPWGIGFKDLLKVESNMKWRLVSFLHRK
jgi:glutamate--cysteine ligase catalytic subunit